MQPSNSAVVSESWGNGLLAFDSENSTEVLGGWRMEMNSECWVVFLLNVFVAYSSPLWGQDSHFDEYMFPRGWKTPKICLWIRLVFKAGCKLDIDSRPGVNFNLFMCLLHLGLECLWLVNLPPPPGHARPYHLSLGILYSRIDHWVPLIRP